MLLLPLKVATFFSFSLSLTAGRMYVGPGDYQAGRDITSPGHDYVQNRKFICTGSSTCSQGPNANDEFECFGSNCHREGNYIIHSIRNSKWIFIFTGSTSRRKRRQRRIYMWRLFQLQHQQYRPIPAAPSSSTASDHTRRGWLLPGGISILRASTSGPQQ